jgi:competence protein ComEA
MGMSRRNAEAGTTASASRARRRLAATLGAADHSAGGATSGFAPGTAPGTAPGLLDLADGGSGHESFTYDGGALPLRDDDTHPDALDGGSQVRSRFRWRTGLRVAVLLGLVSLLLGGWFWWDVATGSPRVVPLSDVSSSGDAGTEAGSSAGPSPAVSGGGSTGDAVSGNKIVVHVAGAVNRPGVVELPQGSRIHEAIAAAGGNTSSADLNRLNLAAGLEDGQKIHVPQLGDPAGGDDPAADGSGKPGGIGSGAGTGTGTGAAGPKIDLNSAGAEELGTLPRVGPVLAQRIVAWRTEHGRFKTVEELDAVDGVGPKMLETLLPLVKVS